MQLQTTIERSGNPIRVIVTATVQPQTEATDAEMEIQSVLTEFGQLVELSDDEAGRITAELWAQYLPNK